MAINTLEHCEEAYIDQIIHHLASLTTHSTLITVNTVLLGGMPRSINRSDSWWVKRLAGAFNFSYFRRSGDGFTLIAEPLRSHHQPQSDAHNIGQTPLANSTAAT